MITHLFKLIMNQLKIYVLFTYPGNNTNKFLVEKHHF